MEAAAKFLGEMEVPFEINALSAHRTPGLVAEFAEGAAARGIEVIIAAAGGAAHLPGVIAASTPLPVIGVPIRSSNSIDGVDSLYSIVQMPSGIPVATVAIDGAQNAAILACQVLAVGDGALRERLVAFKAGLARKIEKANADLAAVKLPFKTN
jgi:5-(carboxyamino)imidazole ribonucleotide mutase